MARDNKIPCGQSRGDPTRSGAGTWIFIPRGLNINRMETVKKLLPWVPLEDPIRYSSDSLFVYFVILRERDTITDLK